MRRALSQIAASLMVATVLAFALKTTAHPSSLPSTFHEVRHGARDVNGVGALASQRRLMRAERLGKRNLLPVSAHLSLEQCTPKSQYPLLDLGSLMGGNDKDNKAMNITYGHPRRHPHDDPCRTSCFPALDFEMPENPPDSLSDWWCSPDDEYAFMGFSYEITACQSQAQLTKDFKDARSHFKARYVRLYGACDTPKYYDTVIEAAWEAGIGVQALIWFGFDGDDKWKTRRDQLVQTIQKNPKAPFVTRAIQFGSEPLFDQVLPPRQLADQVRMLQAKTHPYGINVTVSDLVYGFMSQMDQGAQDLLNQLDFVDLHMLPYFAQNATTGDKGILNDMADQDYIDKHTCGKKVYWTENGWPSKHHCPDVCPNSKDAVSDVKNEQLYFESLDDNCDYFRKNGIGWFAHIYSDDQEDGYGIYDSRGKLKFHFAPKTECREKRDEKQPRKPHSQPRKGHPKLKSHKPQ